MPDNDEVSNAGNGVPAPLLGSALRAESSEKTSEDHNDVCNDGHGNVSTIHTSKQAKVEQKERRSESPIDVTRPEDLALDLVEGVGDVFMLGANGGAVD